jgi:hypothetical protein
MAVIVREKVKGSGDRLRRGLRRGYLDTRRGEIVACGGK